jgi:hypothetical protein
MKWKEKIHLTRIDRMETRRESEKETEISSQAALVFLSLLSLFFGVSLLLC